MFNTGWSPDANSCRYPDEKIYKSLHNVIHIIDEKRFKVRLGLGSLMPLSIIFHLDHGGNFF